MAGLRLKRALNDAQARQEAARRHAATVTSVTQPRLRDQLTVSAQRALDFCVGLVMIDQSLRRLQGRLGRRQSPAGMPSGGLMAISNFIEAVVPANEQEHVSHLDFASSADLYLNC